MLNFYTETTFQVKPASTDSVVHLRIPRRNGSYNKSKFSTIENDIYKISTRDGALFSTHHLASDSAIYFRASNTYPRTFLWRVVAESKALEIQCADLARAESDVKEAYLTLKLEFQDQILPKGIAFADLDKKDELHVFVCLQSNEIFDLKIPTKAFRERDVLQPDIGDWYQPVDSSTLSLDTAYMLYAASPLEIFVSYISGRVQRLKRRSTEGQWMQDNYDETTWMGSLRGLVSRRSALRIEHGARSLDGRTVHAMTISSDGNFLFTICLNHTLRVWHLPSGTLASTNDLLDLSRDPNDTMHLNPSDGVFLQWFKPAPHKLPQLLTYSPQDGGQFKFWEIRGGLTEQLVVQDMYPNIQLSSPDPDPSGNTVWSLIGFTLSPGTDVRPCQLWVLWRNNNYHQLYTLSFQYGDLSTAWRANWVKCVHHSPQEACPEYLRGDVEDPTNKWLDFFFTTGRYSEAGLETALSIYEAATSVKLTASQKQRPLRERMCNIVATSVALRKYDESEMDFDRFGIDTDTQWRNLFRIVEKLNDERQAPLSIAYDSFSSMVWILMADNCCAVRECSKLELLQENSIVDFDTLEDVAAVQWPHRKVSSDDGESLKDLAILISAARTFRASFPAELSRDLMIVIEEETTITPEFATPTRIYDIYDSVGFSDSISNDVFDRLEADLEPVGGAAALNDELFIAILELIGDKMKRGKTALRNTLFSSLLFSAGIADTISAIRQMLLDLAALIIFVEGELNQEEVKMSSFDCSELFERIMDQWKLYNRNLWLVRHQRAVPLQFLGAHRGTSSRTGSQIEPTDTRIVSIFEDTLSKAVRLQPAAEKPLTFLITDQLAEMSDWATSASPDEAAVYLQCDLLANDELELATDFQQFLPCNNWSTYIKGRLALEKDEYDLAASCFRKASYGLSCGKAIGNLVELSAGLISAIEAESFNNGLAQYFHHIVTLFDNAHVYTHAAFFARLSLQSLLPNQKQPATNFRTDVLSRLFISELKSSNFAAAYEALIQVPDSALQRSSIMTLVNVIVSSCSCRESVNIITSLPWALHPPLQKHLDEHLDSLAKRQLSTSLSHTSGSTIDFLGMIHALRIAQKDFRGSASVLFDRLRLVKQAGRTRHDPQSTALREVLLDLINTLACLKTEDAYVIGEVESEKHRVNSNSHREVQDGGEGRKRQRIIVTLEDLRKEYQSVLDRCARIERGDFDFDEAGDTDESDEGDQMPIDEQSMFNLNRPSRSGSSQGSTSVNSYHLSRGMAGDAMEF